MHRLYLVRSVRPEPREHEKRSAKVIELRIRREARAARLRPVPPRDRPAA